MRPAIVLASDTQKGAERMDTEVAMRNPRGSDKRKFDEWAVRLPGGQSAKFMIHIAYVDGVGVLTATSESNHFRDVIINDTDINGLRRKVEAHVSDVVAREISEGWTGGAVVETRWDAGTDTLGRYDFSLKIRMEPMDFRPGDPPGNRGERVVRNAFGQKTVIERGHRDDFSDMRLVAGSMMDPEVRDRLSSPLINEYGDPVSRAVIGSAAVSAEAEALRTLERFADIFSARMSAASHGRSGPVTPAEMVEMMTDAATRTDLVHTARRSSF